MGRGLPAALDEIKAIKEEIRKREQELLALKKKRHALVVTALGFGTVTFADISAHCGEPPGRTSREFREQVERQQRAETTPKPKGGARPRPPKRAPDPGDTKYINSAEIARMAGVTPASVSNWKKRHEDFPAPAPLDTATVLYPRKTVVAYLVEHGYLPDEAR